MESVRLFGLLWEPKHLQKSIEMLDAIFDANKGQRIGNLVSAPRNAYGPWGEY